MELSEAHSSVSQASRQSKNLDDVQALLDMKVCCVLYLLANNNSCCQTLY